MRLALAAARDQDRRLLELRYLAGWSNHELADLLGISPGTVRKRLHDARRRLRPDLEHFNSREPSTSPYRDLLGAVHHPGVDVATPPRLRPPEDAPTITGLKAIDAFAPVRRGGTIEMVGPAGTGHVVVTFELLYRLARTEHGSACIGVGRAGAAIGSQPDLAHIVTGAGIPGPDAAVLNKGADETSRAFDAAARIAAGLAADGSVTVVALNTHDREIAPVGPLGLDAVLTFSMEHLVLGIFPAIDGARSTSVLEITDTAKATKKRLAEAAALRAWFNQPMFVARDFTGEDGTWVEPDTVEAELAGLVQ